MSSPTRQQALSHHTQQAATAAAAATVVGQMVGQRQPWARVLTALAQYQLAAAQFAVQTVAGWAGAQTSIIDPRPFAGVSSAGFPAAEPLMSALDRVSPAPPAALPEAWWQDLELETQRITAAAARITEGLVKDTARSAAAAEIFTRPDWQNYVRMLTPPSCKRCVVLAGRIYRDLDGFDRHPPTCDCVHVPVQSWEQAHDEGLVVSAQTAFENGWVRDLSKADAAAITDGADINQVVNASQGMYSADVLGRRVKATRYGTTKRSAWRKAKPSLLVRLRPETIYRLADGDRAEAQRLLRSYGYIRT